MYINTGYLGESDEEIIEDTLELAVNSAGHYKLLTKKQFRTVRHAGRKDYQLIYIAKGKAHFKISNQDIIIDEGNMVLYRPKQSQNYVYVLEENPDIYWVHFSGYKVESYFEDLEEQELNSFYIGMKEEVEAIMDKIIQELQQREEDFFSLCNSYLKQLFIIMKRNRKDRRDKKVVMNKEVQQLIKIFHENYQKPLQIKEYATEVNMSLCWLIRLFKEQVGMTPQCYLIHIRVSKAKELLRTSEYNINEIAEIVGYIDALYFSKIFKKRVGVSPTLYRKRTLEGRV